MAMVPRLAATIAFALAAGTADAAEVLTHRVDGGVIALQRQGGIGPGVPPARASEDPPLVLTADGGAFQIALDGGRIRLEPAPAPPPDVRGAGMLPDGEVTIGRGSIGSARLTGPTERYRHGILGDAIEASALSVERGDGDVVELHLDERSVFEDRRARIADLDGDRIEELLVVRSYLDRGAALSVVALGPDGLEVRAETPPIGRPHRWLNPVGAADFDGDGITEVAYVETPHIGGILVVYEYRAGALSLEHRIPGFSNHAIGSRTQDLAALLDWNGDGIPDIAIPDARRRTLRIVTFAGGSFAELDRIESPSPITTAVVAAVLPRDNVAAIAYGLADGTLVVVSP